MAKKKVKKKPAKKMVKRAPKKAKKLVKKSTKKSTSAMKAKGASKAKKPARKAKRARTPMAQPIMTDFSVSIPDVETTETIIIEAIESPMPDESSMPPSSMENDTLMSG